MAEVAGDLGGQVVTDVGQVVLADDVEALFRAHYGRLVRALTVAGGSREAAADAVQEAFVKAHLHWRRIRRYDDPVGWIRRVAINRLRDEHRRQERKARALQRMANERPDANEPGIDETTAMLAKLPRQQRLAVALFYVDGMSVADVANAMQLSEGAVKFHLHAGRAKLREQIAREELT
ncbi:MAG: sigma-70 family RNA polymerase sigma factor [Ilumatobacteraceae bacterium]